MRCWYTLDGNGHKLLARSPGKCSVTTLKGFPPASNFAKTRLRPCLDFICRSSPELLHDPSKDYAVYILDPTEAAAAPSAALAAVGGGGGGEEKRFENGLGRVWASCGSVARCPRSLSPCRVVPPNRSIFNFFVCTRSSCPQSHSRWFSWTSVPSHSQKTLKRQHTENAIQYIQFDRRTVAQELDVRI